MNFTCNALIVGFTVAGRRLTSESRDLFILQIWRKNISQNSAPYYQAGSVSVNRGECAATWTYVDNTFKCILRDNFQASVQP